MAEDEVYWLRRVLDAYARGQIITHEGGFTVNDGKPDVEKHLALTLPDMRTTLEILSRLEAELNIPKLSPEDELIVDEIVDLVRRNTANAALLQKLMLGEPRSDSEIERSLSALWERISPAERTQTLVDWIASQVRSNANDGERIEFCRNWLGRLSVAFQRSSWLQRLEIENIQVLPIFRHLRDAMVCYLFDCGLAFLLTSRSVLELALKTGMHQGEADSPGLSALIDTAEQRGVLEAPLVSAARTIARFGNNAAHDVDFTTKELSVKKAEEILTNLRLIVEALFGTRSQAASG